MQSIRMSEINRKKKAIVETKIFIKIDTKISVKTTS